MLLDDYWPILIFGVIAMGFPTISFFMSRFFRPTRDTPLKRETYECGEVPIGGARIQFHFQYYMFAIIFVVFDVITIFLLIWALSFSNLGDDSKILMMAFFGLLLVGVYYALKKEENLWI